MNFSLIVLLPSPPNLPVISDGEQEQQRLSVWQFGKKKNLSFEELKKTADLYLVVPMSALSWHRVKLPTKQGGQSKKFLYQIVRNILEPQLIEDLESYHFALEPEGEQALMRGDSCLVAVWNAQWLREWMAQFEAQGLRVKSVLPQIPLSSSKALNLYLSEQNLFCAPLDGIPLIFSNPDEAQQLTDYVIQDDEEWAQSLMQSRWNLTQKDYSASRWGKSGGAGIALGAALAFAFLSLVIGLHLRWGWYYYAVQKQEAALEEAVRKEFPSLQIFVDVPVQIQRELDSLRTQARVAHPSDLLPQLSAEGARMKSSENNENSEKLTWPRRLIYSDRRLNLTSSEPEAP